MALAGFSEHFSSCEMMYIFENCWKDQFNSKLLSAVLREYKSGVLSSIHNLHVLINSLFVYPHLQLLRSEKPNHYPMLLHHIITSGGNDPTDVAMMFHILHMQVENYQPDVLKEIPSNDLPLSALRDIRKDLLRIKPILDDEDPSTFDAIVQAIESRFKVPSILLLSPSSSSSSSSSPSSDDDGDF